MDIQHIEDVSDIFDIWHCYTRYFLSVPIAYNCHKKAVAKRLLPIRKHREERENGIASAVPFSHFSIDAVTFDISKAPIPL